MLFNQTKLANQLGGDKRLYEKEKGLPLQSFELRLCISNRVVLPKGLPLRSFELHLCISDRVVLPGHMQQTECPKRC